MFAKMLERLVYKSGFQKDQSVIIQTPFFSWSTKLTTVSEKKYLTKFLWNFGKYSTLLVIQFPRANYVHGWEKTSFVQTITCTCLYCKNINSLEQIDRVDIF